jgi:hypothetical protein
VDISSSSENLENLNDPPFLVHPETGEISVNFDPQKGMKGYFEFVVTVSDKAGHTDEAQVQIYLLRADQVRNLISHINFQAFEVLEHVDSIIILESPICYTQSSLHHSRTDE